MNQVGVMIKGWITAWVEGRAMKWVTKRAAEWIMKTAWIMKRGSQWKATTVLLMVWTTALAQWKTASWQRQCLPVSPVIIKQLLNILKQVFGMWRRVLFQERKLKVKPIAFLLPKTL